jgi:hypothetical protein
MLPVALLANPLAKYATAALAAVLLLGTVYVRGRYDGSAIVEAAVAKEKAAWQVRVAQVQGASDVKAQQVADDYALRAAAYQKQIDELRNRPPRVRVLWKDRIVEKEVERIVRVYVPAAADPAIPRGFVDLHNTAAAGLPLSTEQKPNAGEATDKKLSDVGETVAANYYQCNAVSAQLEALQKVVREYQQRQQEITR